MGLIKMLLAFVVVLGTVIIVHEFGHYLIARLCGVKVLRFSVGFGRALAARRFGRDQTEWMLAAFPLGGYVKMLDEREGPVAPARSPPRLQPAIGVQALRHRAGRSGGQLHPRHTSVLGAVHPRRAGIASGGRCAGARNAGGGGRVSERRHYRRASAIGRYAPGKTSDSRC